MEGVQATLQSYFKPISCYPISNEDACNTVALGAASYRFDEMYRGMEVFTTNRLLEAILTRSENGHKYIPLVPLTCEPSEKFSRVDRTFRLQRDCISVSKPLFRGVGPTDHQLSPMRDLRFELNSILREGTAYSLSYRMTPNKTVEFLASFETIEGDLKAHAVVDLSVGNETPTKEKLCQVNIV